MTIPLFALAVPSALAGAPIVTGAPPARTLALEGTAHDQRVDVVVEAADATCRIHRTTIVAQDGTSVSVSLGVLGDALAGWAAEQGALSAVPADGAVPPCDLPAVDVAVVPSGGWAVGVHHSPTEVRVDGPVSLRPLGEDERWWHVVATAPGEAQLAFLHERAPPTRLRLVLDPAAPPPDGKEIVVGRGGAATLPLEQAFVAAALASDRMATLVPMGRKLVALGMATGRADGVVREEGVLPYPVSVVVLPELGRPSGLAYPVRAGTNRRVRPDVQVRTAVSADPSVVAVDVSRDRLVFAAGECPEVCEVDVVLLDVEEEIHIVRIVVN